MKSALRVKAVVSANGRLRLLERVELPAGECEVVVLPVGQTPSEQPITRPITGALKRLAGLWAGRKDIVDSEAYASKLRDDLEAGRDRRD